jgi:hypothetical protein
LVEKRQIAGAVADGLLPSLIQNRRKDKRESVRQTQNILGVTVLTLGFFSAVPPIRATEPPESNTNDNVLGEPAASSESILKIGKQPISLQIGGKYYADSPRYGPDWGVRFALTLLYPTGRRPESIETTGFVK